MKEQERKIIKLLLNNMAFEGAKEHFEAPPPEVSKALFTQIEKIKIPQRYNRNEGMYTYVSVDFPEGTTPSKSAKSTSV
jgi:hypothetical protein